jgi:hypothetical protein
MWSIRSHFFLTIILGSSAWGYAAQEGNEEKAQLSRVISTFTDSKTIKSDEETYKRTIAEGCGKYRGAVQRIPDLV